MLKPKLDKPFALESKITELRKQVEKLAQSQKVSNEGESTRKTDYLVVSSNSVRKFSKVPGMPRAWYCFKCGEDSHIAAHCPNEPNPTLICWKNAELRERQEKFKAQQAASPFPLNL